MFTASVSLAVPALGVFQRLGDHAFRELGDHADFFGDGYEHLGADHAERRRVPPGQHLEARQFAGHRSICCS
jgi:hypothetical protein